MKSMLDSELLGKRSIKKENNIKNKKQQKKKETHHDTEVF